MAQQQRHTILPAGGIRRHAPCLLAILFLTLAIYGHTLTFEFLSNWDDPQYITLNQTIRGFTWPHLVEAFTRPWVGNYAPVQMLSYMADHLLWGLNPAGFHLTSLLLHGANGMLLYALVTRLNGRQTTGLIAALIFIAHPVQVESVVWLSQRKTLLALFFYLFAFLSYLRAEVNDRHSRLFSALAVGAFIVALLAKSVALVLPLCLAVYEFTLAGKRPFQGVCRRLFPFALAAVAMAVLTAYTQQAETGGGRIPYHGGSPWATLLTMMPVAVHYLQLLLFPAGLSALYIHPIRAVPDGSVLLSAALLLSLGAVAATYARRSPNMLFWVAMFLLPLLPVSQIIPLVTLINDRYLYFPIVGAAGLAGHAACHLYAGLTGDRRRLATGAAAGLILLLSGGAYLRTGVWRNAVTLWSDAAGKYPASKDIGTMLAEAQKNAGMPGEAGESYRRLFALPGDFADPRHEQEALQDAALLFMETGSFGEAEQLLLRLTEKFPGNSSAFAFLAACYNATGRRDAAETAYLRAMQIAPANPQGMIGLASLYLDRHQPDKAAPLLDRADAVTAEGPDLRVALARLAAQRGNTDQALSQLEKARQLGLTTPARLRLVQDFSLLADNPRFRELTSPSP